MGSFRSTKVFDGYSTVFRQWKAEGTHCQISPWLWSKFKVWFEGELDERNWVWDFGGMKRAKGTIDGMNPKAWMDYMLDHTTIVAEDDPELEGFKAMDKIWSYPTTNYPSYRSRTFCRIFYNKLNTIYSRRNRWSC
jgi:6-pyruvoyltetrahydropterin/6-carboxytetrahydropterin synthase